MQKSMKGQTVTHKVSIYQQISCDINPVPSPSSKKKEKKNQRWTYIERDGTKESADLKLSLQNNCLNLIN